MKILVLDYSSIAVDRNTILEHLYSFQNYSDHQVLYINAYYWIPPFLHLLPFDMIIYHYTFLSQKWSGKEHFSKLTKKVEKLKKCGAYSVAMPQDEYVNSDLLNEFFKKLNVHSLYTCLEESEWEKVNPKAKSGLKHYKTVLTGYIDDRSLNLVPKYYKPHSERSLDIGYRARKLPFWLGKHGTIKWRLTEIFQAACKKTNLNVDLSNRYEDVFMGDSWYEFLADCRVVLGCEGGSSLHDPDGEIRKEVDLYMDMHPDASFEEVDKNVLKGRDGNLNLFAISPRHFEAVMTKTCQVLVEGNYHGIFKPDIHYIPLKKDFSNIDEVLLKIQDQDYCEKMAEKAYEDIVLNSDYTYRKFVNEIMSDAEIYRQPKKKLFSESIAKSLIFNYGRAYRKGISAGFRYIQIRGLIQYRFKVLISYFYQYTYPIFRPLMAAIVPFLQKQLLKLEKSGHRETVSNLYQKLPIYRLYLKLKQTYRV